ncbi:hypothetical protein A4X13_0g7063 [Tilletia indica]|uniref:Uncharacterized protein n=1 Tax=Tilletia indica TaxID=43049 RepID=A0A177TIT6_9BASI|nr:hypothetical protein A4X13_0g7063 [Tilletia indica]
MPSSFTIQVLTLRPISFPSKQQSVAFYPSEAFTLLFGGTRHSDRYGAAASPVRSADFHFDDQFLCPDHSTITVSSGQAIMRQHRKADAIRINGRILVDDEQVQLQDSDTVELGYPDEYDGHFRRKSAFQVFLTDPSVMAQHRCQALPTAALIPIAPNLLAELASEAAIAQQLRSELQDVQQQLQEALNTATAHVCAPASPPRPYGTLLADLRSSAEVERLSGSVSPSTSLASSTSISSSSSRSSPSLLEYGSSPSSLKRCSAVAASSVASASTSITSGTSVLTSVLRTGSSNPRSLDSDASSSTSCSSSPDDALTPPSTVSSSVSTASILSPVLRLASISSSPQTPVVSSSPDESSSAPSPAATSMTEQPQPSPLVRAPSYPSSSVFSMKQSVLQERTTTTRLRSPSIVEQCPFALDTSTARPLASSIEHLPVEDTCFDGGMHGRFASTETAMRPGSSVDIAMGRVRTAWMRARAELLTVPRDVQHAQVATSRVLRAWQTARAAIACSSASATHCTTAAASRIPEHLTTRTQPTTPP